MAHVTGGPLRSVVAVAAVTGTATLGRPSPTERIIVLGAETPFLGDDLIVWLLLALGAAMLAGNVAALLRPPGKSRPGALPEAPRARSITFVVLGALMTVWALGSLVGVGR